jgi:hypothetical protein
VHICSYLFEKVAFETANQHNAHNSGQDFTAANKGIPTPFGKFGAQFGPDFEEAQALITYKLID